MMEMKAAILPMGEEEWSLLGATQEGASLLTIVNLVEGEILEFMEGKNEITMTELIDKFSWPKPVVIMGIGGLIDKGLLRARRQNTYILLSKKVLIPAEVGFKRHDND